MYNQVNGRFRSASPGLPAGIRRAFEQSRELRSGEPAGDYYEFGVFRGHSLIAAQRAADETGMTGMRFYGFDSFRGLPSIDGIDTTHDKFFEGQFSCSKSTVEKTLTARGFDWTRAELIEGIYSESLTPDLKSQFPFKPVTIALLDCDLFSSTRDALSWLADLLVDRSLLLFDDWYSYDDDPELGQQKALADFIRQHPHLEFEELWEFAEAGMAFLVRQRTAELE